MRFFVLKFAFILIKSLYDDLLLLNSFNLQVLFKLSVRYSRYHY